MTKSAGAPTVALVAAEMTPYAKVGGLADVIGSLPQALAEAGARVAVVLPGHRSVLSQLATEPAGEESSVEVGAERERFSVLRTLRADRVTLYVIDHPGYFGRDGVYGDDRGDYPDNLRRFVFFGRAAAQTLARVVRPDVVHAHDWHCAMVPILMRADPALSQQFAAAVSVFTIHNLAFQGIYDAAQFRLLNLDPGYFTVACLEFFGRINLMKGAAVLADAATTVSSTYAREVTEDPELGFGLEGVLRAKGERFVGILNGADYGEWNPASDEVIAARYTAADPRGKEACARALREGLKLPPAAGRPLVGMVTRMTPQKGFDLLMEALPALMQLDLQVVILGSGEAAVQDSFRSAEERYPERLRTVIGFDNVLAHRIQAGCDMFLMPSRFEPCGLTQMYALKYGTVPVVRATGGLADTVAEFDPRSGRGNGFLFRPYRVEELLAAMNRALAVYRQPEIWQRLMSNCFAADFSWTQAARRYLTLFSRLGAGMR